MDFLQLFKKPFRLGRFPRVVGIDLTGSERRATGWALLEGEKAETRLLRADDDIIRAAVECRVDLVSIDSPLSLPEGRDCVGDACTCRQYGIMRACERELRKRGISVYPCLLPSMQALTARGIRLAGVFRRMGLEVIESYPGAAQDILGIPRKKSGLLSLKEGLVDYGLDQNLLAKPMVHDELDAVTAALVGYFYLAGAYEALGNEAEGYLIIPKPKTIPEPSLRVKKEEGMPEYALIETPFGWMGVAGGGKGLKRVILPYPDREGVKRAMADEFPGVQEDSMVLNAVSAILQGYFRGEKWSQPPTLDWSGYSDFFVQVWKAAQQIPWGEVRTYQWLGQYLNRPEAARAVGNALGKNPFPIFVPCHRVVRKDAGLGGFSTPLGVLLKRKMLELEGVRFHPNGKVILPKEMES